MRTLTALLPALLLAATPAAAQESVAFTLHPPKAAKLAEPFKVRLEAVYSDKYSLKPDTSTAGNEDFEVLSFSRLSSAAAGGKRTDTFEIAAKPFTLGRSTFPAVTWELFSPGAQALEAASPAFPLEVKPAFDKTTAGIRDIYPPFRFIPWAWILAGLAAAALAAWLYRRYRKASPGGAFARRYPWRDARTPYQRARERLERLSASPLAASGRFKELYTGLASVLRLYLGEEFAIDAELMTTSDLMKRLKATGTDLKTTLRTRKFLEKADLVKFAKQRPDDAAADCGEALDLLGEFARAAENARAAAAEREEALKAQRQAGGGKP